LYAAAMKSMMSVSVETYSTRSESRKFYQEVRRLKEGYQPQSTTCQDKEGSLVGGEERLSTDGCSTSKSL